MSLCALLYVVCGAAIVAAQKLSFISPDPLVTGNGLPYYTVGQTVNITWSTDFEYTTLRVFQERDDGDYVTEVLAANYTRANTTYTWEATALENTALGHAFHFLLQNGHNDNCAGCTLNSASFNVSQKAVTASSTLSTATSSSTTSSSTSTSSTQVTAAAAPSSSSTPSSSPASSSSTRENLRIGLGVGLGVGIPLVLAIMLLCVLTVRRGRKEQREQDLPRGRQSIGPVSWSQEQMREHPGFAPSHAQQYMQDARRGSRPGTSDHSGFSHSSWIDPFDFEIPEMREQDAMSQLRNSIYSSRKSEMSYEGATDMSSLGGIPEEPQPAYFGRHGPDRWPLE